MIITVTGNSLGRKGLIWLHLPTTGHREGKPRQELKVGTEVEAMDKHCLLACITWFAQSALLNSPDHLSRYGTAPSCWVLSRQSLIKKLLHRFAYKLIHWRYFLKSGSFFLDDSGLCQVDKKQTNKNKTIN